MENWDDENFSDGFDDAALAKRMDVGLWKKLFAYARRYPRDLFWLGVCAFVTACMEVAYPLLTRGVVDEVAEKGGEANLLFWGLCYLTVTAAIAIAITGFVQIAGKIRTHVSHDIRAAGFDNLQKLSFSYYDHRPVGWLMARMTSDCERLSNILAWGFLDLIWGSTMMLGISIAMIAMNPKLALVVLGVIPLLAWVSAKFQRRILTSARVVRATNSRITASYNEAIMGVLTSKSFVREDSNQKDFGELTGRMYGASVLNLTQAAIYLPLVITLASLVMGLTLAIGGFDVMNGVVTAGTLVAFMAYARHFFEPVEELGAWFAEMQMAQASAERILSLIEATPEIKDSQEVRRALDIQRKANAHSERKNIASDGGDQQIETIELRNLSFAYDSEKPVLDGINLNVKRGETVAIVGPTGGGKSTLVNLICRFYEPTSGQVLINNVDYKNRGLDWLQSNLGMVLQNAHVFSGTIMENIRYGKLTATDEDVVAAAKLAGAHEFIVAMENGYESPTGEGGGSLSAGQKQLVSFARAILSDPQILVMDEATSSVDTETEQRIQQGLGNVLEGRIAFVIAHRLSTIRNAHRILVIAEGKIQEMGSHQDLMAKGGRYQALYRAQSLQETTAAL